MTDAELITRILTDLGITALTDIFPERRLTREEPHAHIDQLAAANGARRPKRPQPDASGGQPSTKTACPVRL